MSKNILITGGTGSWGQELTAQLLQTDANITIMARNEANIVSMSRKWPELKYVVGDVRDYDKVYNTLKNIESVFHLAAIKHVPICEEQPEEAIHTNINGTLNIIKACSRLKIPEAVLVSTDKAVDPVNTYGISKAMAEKLFLNAGYKVIRAGNVIGTSGSMIPLFRSQIETKSPITLTDKNMTRFLMTKKQAISLVLKAHNIINNKETAVVKMPSFKLTDIIKVMAGEDYPIIEIGIRPGEKLDEVLTSIVEIPKSYLYQDMIVITDNPKEGYKKFNKQLNSKDTENNLDTLKILLKDYI